MSASHRVRALGALALTLACGTAGACSCKEDAPAELAGARLDLLARRPDALVELRAVLPQGDIEGTITWGESEGPGWSQVDHLAGATHYRETNQAVASLFLHATRPAERELELVLWCARPGGPEPSHATVTLNGIDLTQGGLVPASEPATVRLHAPEAAWQRGANLLEISVPVLERGGEVAWDTLALASVRFGDEARVTLDHEGGSARFVDGTGARWALELASDAMVTLTGTASAPGVLLVRTGTLDPRSGRVALDEGEPARFEFGPARGEARFPLLRGTGSTRVLDLEWYSPQGSELVLETLEAREHASPPRPPIVFVSIDTFAARHLSLHGYDRATTPELERFARDAVVFERCLANAPWTLPSYLSVMSGLYPRSHWVALDFQQGSAIHPFDQFVLAPNRWTMAEALRARGYRTAGFVDTQWLSPQCGVGQGFDLYDGQAAMASFADVHAGIELIVERLVPPWLATTDADRPPFLFLHALDAHGPYLPEEPFRDAFSKELPESPTRVAAGSINQTYRTIPTWMGLTLSPTPGEEAPLPETLPVEPLVARYDETLLKVDAYLGRLFALLRERGLYDDAAIVISGDHGEFFGPGVYGHGVMREAVLHVPLLLKLPGNAHGGARVTRAVSLVDVYPTVLELAGVPADPVRLHGESLLGLLGGDARADERAHFSECGHVEQYALTLGRWRLVEERPGSESGEASLLTHPRVPDAWLEEHCPELLTRPLTETLLLELLARPGFREAVRELRELVAGPYHSLYDTRADPGDLRDLAAERPEIVAQLLPLLQAEKERSRRAGAEADPLLVRPSLPAGARAELEALGYGGGPDEAAPEAPVEAELPRGE